MRNLRLASLVLMGVGALAGCSAIEDGGDFADGSAASQGQATIEPGTLTAGAWDDNRNFDFFEAYLAAHVDLPDQPPLPDSLRLAAHDAFAGERPAAHSLDIAFVVDNTGSMGDEIDYLKVEFASIASRVEAEHPDVPIRWATIAYRDFSDDFVVRASDFSSDPSVAAASLASMSAEGGDDYPEAVAAALSATNGLDWQSDGRLVFWIADAPHHSGEEASVAASLTLANTSGIHIYPVASSGVDELTELTMRSAAQLTGGRYLFLTDDSGVGGEHKEPSLPCYFVTKLDDAVTRMVSIEVSGSYEEPASEDILRTGGDPSDGACQLEDGSVVVAF
jgi:hypothetical protein